MRPIKTEDLRPGMNIWYGGAATKVLQVVMGERTMAIMHERNDGQRFISDTISHDLEIILLSPQDLKQLNKKEAHE